MIILLLQSKPPQPVFGAIQQMWLEPAPIVTISISPGIYLLKRPGGCLSFTAEESPAWSTETSLVPMHPLHLKIGHHSFSYRADTTHFWQPYCCCITSSSSSGTPGLGRQTKKENKNRRHRHRARPAEQLSPLALRIDVLVPPSAAIVNIKKRQRASIEEGTHLSPLALCHDALVPC